MIIGYLGQDWSLISRGSQELHKGLRTLLLGFLFFLLCFFHLCLRFLENCRFAAGEEEGQYRSLYTWPSARFTAILKYSFETLV